uniref:Uncharacterized protein n=1 Tax=Avena sativa TaxID=4498 RepID=A0ACD5Z996_AVESA
MDETEATVLPDDLVREILLRVPTDDVAALFRCAATCKQWRTVIADLSFLRHHWPENVCHLASLLGFFDKRFHKVADSLSFFPISQGSVLGAGRRPLSSFVKSGAPPGHILDSAVPLAARGGLLLVRLAAARDSTHLAVCDLLTGTCDMLSLLEFRISRCACAILAREDCCSLDGKDGRTPLAGYSTIFKVLAMVIGSNDQDCNLYTFSSSKPEWSEPRKCFDEVWQQRNTFALRILPGTNKVTVCRGVAHWLGSYSTDQWNSPCYFTFNVNVRTGQISLTELSIPANELDARNCFGLMLSLTLDGRLSLFQLQKEGLRLNTWTQGNGGCWQRTRVIELKPQNQEWTPVSVAILSREKSGALFIADVYGRVQRADPETGVMEDVTAGVFHRSLGIIPVPIEIDWPALFMSRLAV